MKTLKILVSESISDRHSQRNAAERAIHSLRSDSAQLQIEFPKDSLTYELVISQARECDIFLSLVDRTRHGKELTKGLSAEELYMNEAQASGKAILVFVKFKKEIEPEDRRQKEFLERTREMDGVKFCEPEFESPRQLEAQLADALMDLLAERFQLRVRRPPFQAPSSLRTFVGRESQFKELTDALRRGETVLVYGLDDFGGIGKTELAIRAAHQLRDLFYDGVFWANVSNLRAADTLALWAREFGGFAPLGRGDLRFEFRPISPEARKIEETATRVSAFQQLVRGKHILAILDGVMDDRDDAKIAPLIEALKGFAVMVTSRVRQLPSLKEAVPIVLDSLKEEETWQLFNSVANSGLAERDRALIMEIGHVLDWTPLPLHLVAAHLSEHAESTISELLKKLKDQRNLLETRQWGYAKARANRPAIDFCYDALSANDARFFDMLGAFAGDDFDVGAAAYVTETEPDVAARTLDRMVKLSLVQERYHIGRYHLHPVLRGFAREKLDSAASLSSQDEKLSQSQEAELKMATYYYTIAKENGRKLQGAEIHRAMAILDTELINIFAGQKWAETRHDRVGWELCRNYISGAMTYYFSLKSMWSDWVAWSDTGIEACQKLGDEKGGGAIAGSLGMLYYRKGEFNQAKEFYKHALETMGRIGDVHGVATIYMNLGNLLTEMKEWNQAFESLLKSLRLHERLNDLHGVAQTRANLGVLYAKHGEKDKARAQWNQALEIFDHLKLVNEADIVRKWLKQMPLGRG